MTAIRKTALPAAILLVFLAASVSGALSAAPKPAPRPPGRAAAQPKPGQKPAAGAEEREIAGKVPQPSAAKLPKREYENLDMSKNETRGTFTLSVSAGLYNFTNKTENPTTNTTRTYSLQPLDYTTMLGLDLAFRLGKDKEKDHDTGTGFHYYRSNRGIFTDFELGFKTQRTSEKPSRFNFTESTPSGTTSVPVDVGYDPLLGVNATTAQNLTNARISPALQQGVGKVAADITMVYANAYYHFTPLNFIMNFGSAFRWFDASIGPSLRIWYYKDYSDPVRVTTRNDDWTYSTFMVVYRQYLQFHPKVRLRTHFYFPALTYFTQLAKSPRFNEMEYILNTAIEICAIRTGNVGLIVSFGYEGHWWVANPYSADKFVRTGFAGDGGLTDSRYAGFEHKTRTSWEGFASIGVDFHFGGDATSRDFSVDAGPQVLIPDQAKPAKAAPAAAPAKPVVGPKRR